MRRDPRPGRLAWLRGVHIAAGGLVGLTTAAFVLGRTGWGGVGAALLLLILLFSVDRLRAVLASVLAERSPPR